MRLKLSPNIIVAIFCMAGFALDLAAFHPGFMAPDTIDQYTQAVSGQYNDWHPPAMALWWSVLNTLYKGPLLMLISQLLMLWTSCYLLASAVKNRIWQVVVFLVFLLPFVQNFAGYIIKDSQMALSWLLAVCIMFNHNLRQKHLDKLTGIIVLLLIIYGTCVRVGSPGTELEFAL